MGTSNRKDTALYKHLPGLKAPWSIRSVKLSLADQRAVLEVVFQKGQKGQVWADSTDAPNRACARGWSEPSEPM